MLPYVIGAIVGAVVMGRTKPKTAMTTFQCLGPRTGIIWTAEVMPGQDVIVLHAPGGDSTIALFQKDQHGRFRLLKPLQGYQDTVRLMQKDLEP